MRKLINYIKTFNKVVWLLVFATFIESFGRFLVIPYLSIFLAKKGVSLTSIGAVIGVGPLAAVIFSLIGGHLSDTLGRKPVQIIGVLLSGISFLGFALSGQNLILLAIFNFLTTMTRTFYRPAVNAAIADITPPHKRSEAMSLSRVSINLAYGLAPVLGVYLANQDKPIAFILGAILSIIVALFIAVVIPETAIGLKKEKRNEDSVEIDKNNFDKNTFNIYKKILLDRSFLLWNISNILLVGVYNYISSFLPIVITKKNLSLSLYGAVLTVNAFICTFLQMPVSAIFAKKNIGKICLVSMIGYFIGFILFGFSSISFLLLAGMFILSIGEIVHAAVALRFIPEIAPKALLGRYIGISGFQEFGPFLFSLIGGVILERFDGRVLFTMAAFVAVLAGILQYYADKISKKKKIF